MISPRELSALTDKLVALLTPYCIKLSTLGTGLSVLDADEVRAKAKREVLALLCMVLDPPKEERAPPARIAFTFDERSVATLEELGIDPNDCVVVTLEDPNTGERRDMMIPKDPKTLGRIAER